MYRALITFLFCFSGVALSKTDESYELACTQDHWSLEGRNLVRVATAEEFGKDPAFAAKQELQPPV